MLPHELFKGKIVTWRGDPVRVERVNPKTVTITTEAGAGYRVSPSLLHPAEAGTTFTLAEGANLVLGSLVRFKDAKERARWSDWPLLVVVKRDGRRVDLAPLGGEAGCFIGGAYIEELELVPFKTASVE